MKMMNKLKSQRGESLSEVLIALLISTIGILLLAMMIGASSHIITSSKEALNTYYTKNSQVETHTGPERETGHVKSTGLLIDEPAEGVKVNFYVNQQGNKKVISYTTATTTPGGE